VPSGAARCAYRAMAPPARAERASAALIHDYGVIAPHPITNPSAMPGSRPIGRAARLRGHSSDCAPDVTWIEGGDHLAFWLSPHAPAAQASGRAFLNHHMKSGTPTGGR
jgi:hypothetical protein